MDFHTLLQGGIPAFGANSTDGNGNTTKSGLLMESLAPLLGSQFNPLLKLFMLFHNLAGTRLGVDPTIILTIFGVVWAANKLWKQIFLSLYGAVTQYLTASISIGNNDEMFLHMMKWLASQPHLVNSRALAAETLSMSMWEAEEHMEIATGQIGADGSGIVLNFSNQEAKAPPRFTPAFGLHGFWFKGTYFRLHRKQESLYDDGNTSGTPQFKDKEKLVISCFWRSPEPIKRLLQHAKEQYYADHHAKTIVKRPNSQNVRRFGGRHSWLQVANRPVRPMNTVVLDEKQKIQVLSDMNEYLHPATPRWYANRGIPLRRGYLFHGPPGTGKTSLSFALAGVFGLDIHVISLLDSSLTEEDLSALFSALPRRCVVLLEDIDTAGLARPADQTTDSNDPNSNKKSNGGKSSDKEDWSVSELARELKRQSGPDDKKGISLSGLLNAIDGVASHEGRVLIMTTNKPESLDDALIRPGRVDLQVGFTNATRQQAVELFVRMYEAESPKTPPPAPAPASGKVSPLLPYPEQSPASSTTSSSSSPTTAEFPPAHAAADLTDGSATEVDEFDSGAAAAAEADKTAHLRVVGDETPVTTDELVVIATEFGAKIPEGQIISPAEIQGFLLKRKKNPRRALAEVDVWVKALLAQKASRTKVLQVQ